MGSIFEFRMGKPLTRNQKKDRQLSLFQYFNKGFRKTVFKADFSAKFKVAFSKTEVLKKTQFFSFLIFFYIILFLPSSCSPIGGYWKPFINYEHTGTPGLMFRREGRGSDPITLSVSSGTATAAYVVIPAVSNNFPVTHIEGLDHSSGFDFLWTEGGFAGYTEMRSIVIPDSVKYIGEYAFDGCTGLTSITIPNSVTEIGGSAFSGCTGLTSITLPAVRLDSMFGSSNIPSSLKTVVINRGTYIPQWAFYGCTGLTSITIPDSVRRIEYSAFSGCTGLTNITIPDSVTSISESAFSGCTGLTSITIGANVSLSRNAFDDGFITAYIVEADRQAGTYTRPNTSSTTWTRIVGDGSLAAFLEDLKTTAQSYREYTYEAKADESINPQMLNYEGKNSIRITIKGDNANRNISLSSNGSMFTVYPGVTLILENNITLQGRSQNNTALVAAYGGTVIMNAGSKIVDNINGSSSSNNGGGVALSANSSFTMNGGEISGNYSSGGGGVTLSAGSSFTMKGGKITGNTARNTNISGTAYGGGVLSYGSFKMEGGEISNNTVTAMAPGSSVTDARGGGVYVYQSGFTMSGGKISGNTASASSSTSTAYGGGVYVNGSSGYSGTFTMTGGEISGNSISASLFYRGGGVFIDNPGAGGSSATIFSKTGGTITGYSSDQVNGNVVRNNSGTVQSSQGHAVFVNSTSAKRRETTADSNVSFYSSSSSSSGGWE